MAQSSVLLAFSSELAHLVERASATVVSVDARPRRPGSGIIIGPDLIATADHLLERDEVTVHHGDRRLAATIAGRDPETDIAVLRVQGLGGSRLPGSPVPAVGEIVVSVSRTPSGGVSAGAGIVSVVSGPLRTGHGGRLKQVIRTDAASRPGTSGGAILDSSGSVIAMTTWGVARGVAVGIPIGELLEIADALAANTRPRRAYLGVSVQRVRLHRPRHEGVDSGLLVSGIAPGSPADEAGMLVGDVIVAYAGSRVTDADVLQEALAAVSAGTRTELSLLRGEALQRVDVTLGARPSA